MNDNIFELIVKNDIYFLKSSKTREINNLSKIQKIVTDFNEYGISLNFKLNKPNISKQKGKEYKETFTYDIYKYELEDKFNLDDCITFLCFITKNMINTNISLNNKSYTLDGHYGKYSEPRGDEEEFIIKLFPLDESIIIHNDYIMIACRIIKNDNVNLFLIFTKSEGFCASYSVIAYNNYILNEYVFTNPCEIRSLRSFIVFLHIL